MRRGSRSERCCSARSALPRRVARRLSAVGGRGDAGYAARQRRWREAISALAGDGTLGRTRCARRSRLLATEAEDAGAFALATAMLDFARILVGMGEFRLQGRLLAQQARILRKIGEMDLARELFDEVGDIGITHGDQELIARAHLGKGVSGARARQLSGGSTPSSWPC